MQDNVPGRSVTILGILEFTGSAQVSPIEFVGLLDNSLLVSAVNQTMPTSKNYLIAVWIYQMYQPLNLDRDLDNGLHKKS